jgi:hypothetical protein
VQLLHGRRSIDAAFDDRNLVSCAGLVPVMRLTETVDLAGPVDHRVCLGVSTGANPGGKVATIVAGMAAGADSIDDLDLLVELAERTPLLPGAHACAFIDVDSLLRRVYGHAKQGAGFGHAKVGRRPPRWSRQPGCAAAMRCSPPLTPHPWPPDLPTAPTRADQRQAASRKPSPADPAHPVARTPANIQRATIQPPDPTSSRRIQA